MQKKSNNQPKHKTKYNAIWNIFKENAWLWLSLKDIQKKLQETTPQHLEKQKQLLKNLKNKLEKLEEEKTKTAQLRKTKLNLEKIGIIEQKIEEQKQLIEKQTQILAEQSKKKRTTGKVSSSTLSKYLKILVKEGKIVERIDDMVKPPKTSYILSCTELEKIEYMEKKRAVDQIGYGGRGIHQIKDRRKAKELFDRYLRVLIQRFVYGVFIEIQSMAFSAEGKAIIERTKNGDYWFSVRKDIVNDLISPRFQKVFAFPLSSLSDLLVELLSNADVAFGEFRDDPDSPVFRLIEEVWKDNAKHVDLVHLSQEVGDVLDQQDRVDDGKASKNGNLGDGSVIFLPKELEQKGVGEDGDGGGGVSFVVVNDGGGGGERLIRCSNDEEYRAVFDAMVVKVCQERGLSAKEDVKV